MCTTSKAAARAAIPESIERALARARPRPCPLCGQRQDTPLWFRSLRATTAVNASLAAGREPGWWIVRCRGCGLARVDPAPRPEDLPPLYDEAYFSIGLFNGAVHAGGMSGHLALAADLARRPAWLRWHGRRLAHLESFLSSGPARRGRLLDVGCGAGYFLDAAREAGWQAQGVEPSPAAARVGREQLGLDIFQGTLEQASFLPASFDVITLFEVLEHLYEPAQALAEARRILRPQGLLAIQVPNDHGSYRSQVFRPDNRWWVIPPLHLFFFTAETLTRWLRQVGFEPVYVGTTGSLGSDLLTLLRARGRRPGRLFIAGLRRGLAPLDWVLRRAARHTELLVYARPRF